MPELRHNLARQVLVVVLSAGHFLLARAETTPILPSGFSLTHEVTVPGPPGVIFDAFTGDIRDWWDHHFSEKPKALYIEPNPGGGFYEIFDDSGNGVVHAKVIAADRGELLRMDGPLGLAGNAVSMVHTLEFAAHGTDSTQVKLTVNAVGQIADGVPAAVDGVWRHFLVERFKPYVESGQHLKKVNAKKP